MTFKNKNHWYDGWFYDKIIAPNQDKSFLLLKNFIEDNSTLLDVGCGTGRLSFTLSDKCKKVVGIDLSYKNIKVAKSNLRKSPKPNIEFYHTDINLLSKQNVDKYDYSVLSYVIHEVDEHDRNELLTSLLKISNKIILIDYLFPRPIGIWSYLNEIVEFAAGKEHYKNFNTYVNANGILGLAKQSGLTVYKEIKNYPFTSHFVVLTKE